MELETIRNKIYEIRGLKVMLDFDLAQLYEVETRVLKQSVKRNINRFPSDFMFVITENEADELVSQFVIPSKSKLKDILQPIFFDHKHIKNKRNTAWN